MEWFKVHHRFFTSPKLRSFDFEHRYRLMMLFWIASESNVPGEIDLDVEDIARTLEMEIGDYSTFEAKLKRKGLIRKQGKLTIVDQELFTLCPENPHGRLVGDEWAALRLEVFGRDNYTCQYCGVRGVALECDHVVPISRGGTNDIENLVTACRPCNRSKSDKTPDEWRRQK